LQAGFDETDAFLVMYDDHDLSLTLWFLDAVHHKSVTDVVLVTIHSGGCIRIEAFVLKN